MNKFLDVCFNIVVWTGEAMKTPWFWIVLAIGVAIVIIRLGKMNSFLGGAWRRIKGAAKWTLKLVKSLWFWVVATAATAMKIAVTYWYGPSLFAWAVSLWQWSAEKFGPLGHLGCIILAGLVLWAVAYTILRSTWIIRENHYAVVRGSILASRNNKVVKRGRDGIWFAIPFLERMIFISRKPIDIDVVATVNLKDRLPLSVALNILIEPDSEVVDAQGHNVFASFIADEEVEKEAAEGKEEAIPSGLKKAAMATAEEVCAQIKDFDQLSVMRSAVRDIFYAKFALAKMPHEDHDPATCGVAKCKLKPGKELGMKDLPKFYATHHVMTDKLLDEKTEQSKFEKLFGVKVRRVTCTIEPTDKTNEAFAERQKASAMAEANEYAMKMFDELIDRNVPHEVALNHIQLMLFKEMVQKKQIISLEGVQQVMSGLRAVAKTMTAP